MQVIRLSRTGKQNQASFRIVVAEKARAVKGAYQEILGHYSPSESKKIDFNKERIDYWISKGAWPSDSVAALLKTNGISGLEKYMEPRNKKKRSKSAPPEEPHAPTEKAGVSVPASTPTPAEESPAPAPEVALVPEETGAVESLPEAPAEPPPEAPAESTFEAPVGMSPEEVPPEEASSA